MHWKVEFAEGMDQAKHLFEIFIISILVPKLQRYENI
jgi:hypothetical protein